jgi:SAM-dependent methyltransferase
VGLCPRRLHRRKLADETKINAGADLMTAALARTYASVTEQPGQSASRIQLEMLQARYAWAAQHAHGKDVLEAGCGAGMGLPVLAAVARLVEAGDVDPEHLAAARLACAEYAHVGVRAFDAQDFPFPDESFDVVLLFEAIYYLPDAPRFLGEARRVLRRGGRLLIVTVNPEWTGFNPSPLRTRYWSAQDLLAAFSELGLTGEIQGAFPESPAWIDSMIDLIRRTAVRLHLVPGTMRGKERLKRIFYGRLTPVPSRLAVCGVKPPPLEALSPAGLRRCRVLYATGQKP